MNPIEHPAGPPPAPSRTTYMSLNAKQGCFTFTEEKDGPQLKAQYVMGPLRQVWLEWDEGNPSSDAKKNVPARWEIHCIIDSRDNGLVHLDVSSGAAVYVFASQINQVGTDTYLGITAKPGENATLTEVGVWSGAWSHIYTPKSDGSSLDDRTWKALVELSQHSAYAEPTSGKAFTERRLWSQKKAAETTPSTPPPPAPVPPPFVGSAEGGANPSSMAPGRGVERSTPTPVPAGANAFGFVPTRWPRAESWQVVWGDEQSMVIGRLLENVDRKYHRAIMQAVADQYKKTAQDADVSCFRPINLRDAEAEPTKAHAVFLKEFIDGASQVQWGQAYEVAVGLYNAAQEYDPFAED